MILCMQLRHFPFKYIFQPITSCHPGPGYWHHSSGQLQSPLNYFSLLPPFLLQRVSSSYSIQSQLLTVFQCHLTAHHSKVHAPFCGSEASALTPVCVSHFTLPSPLQLHCNSWSSSNGLLLPQDLHTSSPLCLECLSSISSQIHLSVFFKTYNFRKHLRNRHCFLPSPPHHTLSLNLAKFFYYTKHFIHYFWRLFLTIL